MVNSSCTFDNGECGWMFSGHDEYKCKLQSGKTPESFTGPGRDHTIVSSKVATQT